MKEGDWISGSIKRIADNGWGTFQPDNSSITISVPPKMVQEHNLSENDLIKIITEPSDNKTRTHVKAISKENSAVESPNINSKVLFP
mgnify:CR=1 FL=1